VNLLFTYGTLKPGEIAFGQISKYVERYESASIKSAEIFLRDGLPALKVHQGEGYGHRRVNGYVLTPKPGTDADLIENVKQYEGSNYKQIETEAQLNDGSIVTVVAFVGSKIDQSNPEPWEGDWTTTQSPLLGFGLPALLSNLKLNDPKAPSALGPSGYWREKEYWVGKGSWPGLLKIEGDFLTLTSIFEYVLTLRFGRVFGQDVMRRISAISEEPEMTQAFESLKIETVWNVRDVSNIGAGKASPVNLKKALDACYTVRNNLTHRGKSVKSDAVRVIEASRIISQLLVNYLLLIMPDFKEVWPPEVIAREPK
jgi:gamma-glutamylcyclotransferase (GGCT)/AIG2-like uncharacterized protein YtfP